MPVTELWLASPTTAHQLFGRLHHQSCRLNDGFVHVPSSARVTVPPPRLFFPLLFPTVRLPFHIFHSSVRSIITILLSVYFFFFFFCIQKPLFCFTISIQSAYRFIKCFDPVLLHVKVIKFVRKYSIEIINSSYYIKLNLIQYSVIAS